MVAFRNNFAVLSTFLLSMAALIDFSHQNAVYVRQAELECLIDYPSISMPMLEQIKRTKELPTPAPQDLKCFAHCVSMKLKTIEGDEFVHVMVKQVLQDITGGDVSEGAADDITKKCGSIATHSDKCEKTWEFVICAAEELKDYRIHHTLCETC